MAFEVYRFAVTIPAGTLQAAPQVSALPMPARVVEKIVVVVPPGPRGQVGFQLASGGLQIVPVNAGQFVVADDEKIEWMLTGLLQSGAWQLIAYNAGTNPHTLELRFEVDLLDHSRLPPAFQPILNHLLAG